MTEGGARDDIFRYAGLTYWGPMSPETVDPLLDKMAAVLRAPGQPSRPVVLDMGCGAAEALIRLVEIADVDVVGVDQSAAALELARAKAASRIAPERCRFINSSARAYSPDTPLSGMIWLGGPYLGTTETPDFRSTLERCASWVAPGGCALVGEAFWSRKPDPGFLRATGIEEQEFFEHWQILELAAELGLRCLYSCTSTRREYDAFEWTILYNCELRARAHPDQPGLSSMLSHRRAFNAAQQRWGRDCWGFGLYLFQID